MYVTLNEKERKISNYLISNVHSSRASKACEKTREWRKKNRDRNYTVPIRMVITASYGDEVPEQHFNYKGPVIGVGGAGARGSIMVKALGYKRGSRGFETR
jgi:hypothetical protein